MKIEKEITNQKMENKENKIKEINLNNLNQQMENQNINNLKPKMENANSEKNNNPNNPNALQATMTFLNRQQLDFLDKVGKDSYFKFGHKIPRTKILFEAVQLLMGLNINLDKLDLKTETLSAGILRVIKNRQNANV